MCRVGREASAVRHHERGWGVERHLLYSPRWTWPRCSWKKCFEPCSPLDAGCETPWQTWDNPQRDWLPCTAWWDRPGPDLQSSQKVFHLEEVRSSYVTHSAVVSIASTWLTNIVVVSIVIQPVVSHLATKPEHTSQTSKTIGRSEAAHT